MNYLWDVAWDLRLGLALRLWVLKNDVYSTLEYQPGLKRDQ